LAAEHRLAGEGWRAAEVRWYEAATSQTSAIENGNGCEKATSHSQVDNDTRDYHYHCNNTGSGTLTARTRTPVSLYTLNIGGYQYITEYFR
jgi:hypothetical protein